MKDLVVLILVALAFFFIWNGMKTTRVSSYSTEDTVQDKAISPDITQAILAKALTMKPDIVPIDTVFINQGPDNTYDARISFFNKKHFYGVQYDMKAKVDQGGSVNIISFGDSPQVEASAGYAGGSYQNWQSVTDNLNSQFQQALQGAKNLTGNNSGTTVIDTNLQTRG